MKSPYSICILVIATLWIASDVHAGEEPSALEQIRVVASLRAREGAALCLHIAIRNEGAQGIQLYADDLPWRAAPDLMLSLISIRTGAVVAPRMGAIADPGVNRVRIKENSVVEGDIDLSRYYTGVMEMASRGDSLLVWSFELEDLGRNTRKRFYGVVLFARP